jgi:hypothetical protein
VLWHIVELQSAQQAARFGRRESLVERAGRVGGQIIEDHADALGLGEVNVGEFAHTAQLAVTLSLRHDRWTSRNTNRLVVPLRLYSQS